MALTERAPYSFKVRRSGADRPFLYLEPMKKNLSFLAPEKSYLGNAANFAFLGLEFRQGMNWDEAQRIADLLNDNISNLSITRLIDPDP